MKIALICEHGGHLTEMLLLIDAFKNQDFFFITNKSKRASDLKQRVHTIDAMGNNPILMIRGAFQILRILVRERPDVIISTGAEIAIPAFLIAEIIGVKKKIFIESWCRVYNPSWSGRIVYHFSDLFLVQWPSLLSRYGKKARYIGSVIS